MMKYRMEREYGHACTLRLKVACTGRRGGDASHGGAALVRVENTGGAVLGVVVEPVADVDEWRGTRDDSDPVHAEAVELWAMGDAEMLLLADALLEAGTYLRAILTAKGDA